MNLAVALSYMVEEKLRGSIVYNMANNSYILVIFLESDSVFWQIKLEGSRFFSLHCNTWTIDCTTIPWNSVEWLKGGSEMGVNSQKKIGIKKKCIDAWLCLLESWNQNLTNCCNETDCHWLTCGRYTGYIFNFLLWCK